MSLLRRIKKPLVKKWLSSIQGLFILVTGVGWGSVYILLLVLGSSLIIIYGNKRYCHLSVFSYTFFIITIHNLEDYSGLPKVPRVTIIAKNIFMFKLVHLALEVQEVYCGKLRDSKTSQEDNLTIGDNPTKLQEVNCHQENNSWTERETHCFPHEDPTNIQKEYRSAENDPANSQEVGCAIKNDSKRVQDLIVPKDIDWRTERNLVYTQLSILEIIHFNINSVAICNFMTYRTYYDWIHHPFRYARCREEVLRRLKGIMYKMVCLLLILLTFRGKLAVLRNEFSQSPLLYRVFYSTLAGFCLRLCLHMLFSSLTVLAATAGVGAYPSVTKPVSGGGPTTRFDLLQQIADNPEEGKDIEYTFETVCNGDILKGELSPILRDQWRFYNRTTNYFCKENIYKRFPAKRFKLFATFFLSAYWHGFQGGYWCSLNYSTLYIPVEDLWDDLYRKDATGFARILWDTTFFILRLQAVAFIFLTLCFQFVGAYRFLVSLYFLPFTVPVFLYGLGKFIQIYKTQNFQAL